MSKVTRLMGPSPHASILKRTGTVLVAVGLLDIAVMIYCIVYRISYSSSFNVFAVVAGVFLLRGSLRAASIVRWVSAFMMAAFAALVLAWPLVQPIDLTLAQVRLNPLSTVTSLGLLVLVLALLAWLVRELGRPSMLEARAAAGRKLRDMRIPAALGVGLVAVLVVSLSLLLDGESATKAKSLAQQRLGAGYRYHVASMNVAKTSQGTFVRGVVTAWNEREIRNVPVSWEER